MSTTLRFLDRLKSTLILVATGTLAFFCFAPSVASEAQVCTEMGCENGLSIEIPLEYQWQPGSYRFEFVLDGRQVRCQGSLPLKPCSEQSIVCEPSQPEVSITESGCAIEPSAQGFGSIQISREVSAVSVRIVRDVSEIARGEWKPTYQTTQPNGPGCEPVCRQAMVELKPR